MPVYSKSFPRASERKSRRTHKNSRDGCPNCKSKRIKCSEELPSCHNCIKKNYRCGYLDFPKDKLDMIRKKNDKKAQEIFGNKQESSHKAHVPSPFNFQDSSGNSTQTPPTNLTPLSETPNNSNQLFNDYLPMPIPKENDMDSTPPNIFNKVPQDSFDYFNVPFSKDDLRMAVYTDTMKKLMHDNNNLQLPSYTYDVFETFGDPPQRQELNHYPLHSQLNSVLDNGNFNDLDLDIDTDTDSFENSKTLFNHHFGISVNDTPKDISDNIILPFPPPETPKIGTPLPNAMIKNVSLTSLEYPKRLQQSFMKELYRNEHELLIERTNTMKSPMWTKENDEILWSTIFNKAVTFDVYFSFFMDRSLNVILKICNKSIHSGTSVTCFTSKILEQLTKKSYTYYGSLIKNLRESITQSDIEPAIISWYASWCQYLHSYATIDTLSLMYGGSTSLLCNVLNGCQTLDQIPPSLSVIMHIIESDIVACVAPDYKFDVIEELYKDLVDFKTFIIYNQELTTENNGYILKAFVEVENFVKELIEEIHPKLLYINKFYKSLYKDDDDSNDLKYISPSLLFDLLVKWLNVIPSHAISIGKNMTPLKKTFYLFFTAIGKALSNVYSVIRSVALVDALNIIHPHADFNSKTYQFDISQVSGTEQYQYLYNLSSKLIRVITFFNVRQQLITHYTEKNRETITKECHVKMVEPKHDRMQVEMGDIIHVIPEKVDIKEVMVSNFSINTIINLYNYPILNDFYTNLNDESTELKHAIEHENHDQKIRIKEFRAKYQSKGTHEPKSNPEYINNDNQLHDFDYGTGSFIFDYRIGSALEFFLKHQNQCRTPRTLKQLKDTFVHFESAIKELNKSIESDRQSRNAQTD
ncbi:uncharacterized protein SPAPADRAFT_150267 [Spathaspora passalidarum NRRL Y-27907]|uniref:Zn(2)-C6 fungal-type domain-containing protein n=1 Tax=Spathaspora passalidarum (strain NRRL Y-27907 / 11-Y1) TaxID=619300 RepID=G3AKE5_SPAPN|nr:uncharacterized protein SPAPADRAFT_150267 [Spathaspora passalidarum NRRL Y-27907]EGW32902.1 hypothetical protein SPAPADRAFT_150267 [Spathaspora passalidarum NRRL Y-27907]